MSCGNSKHCTLFPPFCKRKEHRRDPGPASPFPPGTPPAIRHGSEPAPQRIPAPARLPGFDTDAYPFEGLPNTRDLGGIPTQDGRRIKPGKLLRSGALDRATAADLDILANRLKVRTVIDLREACLPESRDGVLLAGKPVECIDAGVSGMRVLIPRPFRNAGWAFMAEIVKMNLRPRAYQTRMYRAIPLDRQNQSSLRTAFQTLLSPRDGAILWHCSIGKDRTGLLAALLLHCLGASRATIMEDYLASGHYLSAFGSEDERTLRTYGWPESMRRKVHETHMPRAEYLNAALGSIEREYGSVNAYLSEALGIGSKERRRLQALYLE